MRSRGLVVMLALVLATLATAGVFLYSRGVKEDARQGGDLATVVVSTVDIPANTDMNDLIRDEMFTTTDVPRDALIDDPITQVSQLRNLRNSVYIFAGEQIPLGRVQGGEVPGGLLNIPTGHQALTVALEAPRAISGALAGGDNITIYGSFSQVKMSLFPQEYLFVRGTHGVDRGMGGAAAAGAEGRVELDATVVVAPEVEILRVARTFTETVSGDEQVDANAPVQVTMALLPDEARRLVFAMEIGEVYMSLLPPDEPGTDLDTLTMWRILLSNAGER
jgi:Flp pilus assembly protein CpaB